jgi:iron(III) transport system substrate-binding protein
MPGLSAPRLALFGGLLVLLACAPARPAEPAAPAPAQAPAASARQPDAAASQQPTENWDTVVAAARQEGKVIISVPASADLRRALETNFERRFPGIDAEFFSARGAEAVNKMLAESKANIYYFDLHIGGTTSTMTLLKPEGLLLPVEPNFILPEVKDPQQWWGGHLWADNEQRYVYGFQAYFTENVWYNTQQVRPEEVTSYDDLLNPKWKGKIGFLDPRTGGSGDSLWAFLWKIKGESFLERLAQQELSIQRNQQDMASQLARGRLSMTLGLTYYSFDPFLEAGTPIKPLATPREGAYMTIGSGAVSVMKNTPHPNATKVFLNWLLSQEGQTVFTDGLGQATRRLDVPTTELIKTGVIAVKDTDYTLADWDRLSNSTEKAVVENREPATQVAFRLFGR